MKEVRIKFIEKIKRTPTVTSFRFSPNEKLDFIPGQFLQLIFDENNRKNKDLNKYLSFSCSPEKPYIEVTKRLSESEFSHKLINLAVGDEILAQAPLGDIVFYPEMKNIAFLIGGIGITPVISILEYICDKNLNTDGLVFYSNRREEDIAFREELDLLRRIGRNIKIFYTITDCVPKDNACVFGFIDKNLIEEKTSDLTKRIVFIYGPPGMVATMKGLCLDLGCKEENVHVENFIGY
ncbi:MAG: FAD-dependent oxidoreductase [Candidatus Omnitrophica bacterium]|jgi:ferredoxin-NADP reductase|nr:FAD-dependent oxidoreductase [Candidatus Omnitrophota bacterium]